VVAPSLRALGAVSSGSTLTPSFAAPAGAVADDVIVIAAFVDDARTTVSAVPTGFLAAPNAPQRNGSSGSPEHVLIVYYGRFSDVGAGPWGFTLTSGATPFVEGRAAAIQDCVTSGSPWDATDGATSGATSGTVAPLVSATSSGADGYAFYAATDWASGAWTPATGFTEQWDANTRIITFDDKSLTTAQTVSPQATCASSSLMNAWVGILLPIPSTPATPKPGNAAHGSKTNAQAGDIVVNSGPLIAGRYRVSVIAKVAGTVTDDDANNIQLLNSGGTVAQIMMPVGGMPCHQNPDMIMNVSAGGTISIVAVANASGTAAIYSAMLAITPEALYS
jgi:hypothetical protein